MNDPFTIMARTLGIVGVTLVAYGVVVSATRMALLSYGIAAAIAGIGMAWAIFAE